jgi:uncharacterized protein YraI
VAPASLRRWFVALWLLLLPVAAFAQPAFTTQSVNVRAGPDAVFPLVTWLPGQTPVSVAGCLEDRKWCDITSGRTRGWVSARYLTNLHGPQTQVVEFSVETYWDQHYRTRPWYDSRASWVDWKNPNFKPPPPPRRSGLLSR